MAVAFTKPIICPILIGRTPVLTNLHSLIDQVRGGQGQVVLLSGEAGIGKSRLVTEAKTYASAQGFLLLQGNCFPTDLSYPYAPLLDLLRSVAASHLATAIVSDLAPFVRELHHLLPDVVSVPPDLAPLSTPDPEQQKRRLFTALAQFFTGQATKQPVLLVIEDIHWSDDTSLEFLHSLARRCPASPLLVLLTYRSDEVYPGLRHFLAQLDRERLVQEFSLAPFTRSEVSVMLHAIFALRRSVFTVPPLVQGELLDALYALTEGNPFFIEEILQSLISAGEIFYVDGAWQRKPLGELHIPRSIQDTVQQRTERLSEPARHVLNLAAVAGRRFDFTLLQQLTQHDEHQLLLLTKAFHRTIVDTMERLYSSTLDAHLADLAYHFYEAGTWEKALAYGQRAGEQAQALYAPQAAIEHFTRALAAASQLSLTPPANLYRARGLAYETLGEFERARADLETALQLAHDTSDRQGQWQASLDLGSLWAGRNYAQTGDYYQRALALARTLDDPAALAYSLNRLGNWYLNVEQSQEALRCHQEALATFEALSDRRGLATTLDLLGVASLLSGDLVQSAEYTRQAIVLLREQDDRQRLISSLMTLMMCVGHYQNDTAVPATLGFAELLQYGELALKIADEIGSRSDEAYVLINMAMFLGPRGEYARALEVAQRGLAIAEEIGHRQWMTAGHRTLGALYLDLLAFSEALQHLEQALALAQEIGSRFWARIASGFLALVSLAQHDVMRAESLLNAALGPDDPAQTVGQRLVWYARTELALARNDPQLALRITDQLLASAANLSEERVIPRLWTLRGEALVALHREAEAEKMLRAALDAAHAQGLRPSLWRLAIDLGKLYQAELRDEEAALAFATAQELIEELAASVPDTSLRDHFLHKASGLIPRQEPLSQRRAAKKAFGGLTERERDVAALIAQGKSNREIAEILVVNYRTIEKHIENILSKLGFASRAQIAVWAAEKGLGQKEQNQL
jgi:DNA-binding CsgD family transcriptional regulator